jgi:hypothetical protein
MIEHESGSKQNCLFAVSAVSCLSAETAITDEEEFNNLQGMHPVVLTYN